LDRASFRRSERGSDGKAREKVPGYPNLRTLKEVRIMILILVVSIFTVTIVTVAVEIQFGKNR
jgi:hypothetical protein